jgi:hypothetical protein
LGHHIQSIGNSRSWFHPPPGVLDGGSSVAVISPSSPVPPVASRGKSPIVRVNPANAIQDDMMTTHRFSPTAFYNTLGSHPPALRIADGDTVIAETGGCAWIRLPP